MHLPTFKWNLCFLYETVLLLQTNDKYKVIERKPAVGYDSIIISCILSYSEWRLSQFIPSYSDLHFYLFLNSRSNWISSSVQQNSVFVTFSIVLYLFHKCFFLSFAFIKRMFNTEYFKNHAHHYSQLHRVC